MFLYTDDLGISSNEEESDEDNNSGKSSYEEESYEDNRSGNSSNEEESYEDNRSGNSSNDEESGEYGDADTEGEICDDDDIDDNIIPEKGRKKKRTESFGAFFC